MQLDIMIPDEAKTITVITAAQRLKLPHQEACKERRRRAKPTVGTEKLFLKCWQTIKPPLPPNPREFPQRQRVLSRSKPQLLLVSNQKVSSNNNK